MPSMWKKQKGNPISRLVADLQAPPKRGNSLVVETGFPTSIADLFVKNHDKLKKSSKKKRRSKQSPPPPSPTTSSAATYDPPWLPVSDSIPKSDAPSCSIDDEIEESVAHKMTTSSLPVDEMVARKNPRVGLSRDYCDYDDVLDEQERERMVPNSKNAVSLFVKGVVVMAVGAYTRSLVLGISIGALLMCILEFLGNSTFRFFKPCENVKRKLRGFSGGKQVRVDDKRKGKSPQDDITNGYNDFSFKSERGGENGAVSSKVMKIKEEINVSMKREIEFGAGNELVSRKDIEQVVGDGVSLKDRIEPGNVTTTLHKGNSCKVEEEFRSKSIFEIEVAEPSSCETSSSVLAPLEPSEVNRAMERGEEGIGSSEVIDQKGKPKKGKKFWGKFVRKQSKKKKNKHKKGQHEPMGARELSSDQLNETSPESEEGNELEDEQDNMVRRAGLSSYLSLTSLDEVEGEGEEQISVANPSNTELLNTSYRTTKSRRITKKKSRNLKCLGILSIVLAGLTGGRVFALVLTVIYCLLFKIIRG